MDFKFIVDHELLLTFLNNYFVCSDILSYEPFLFLLKVPLVEKLMDRALPHINRFNR